MEREEEERAEDLGLRERDQEELDDERILERDAGLNYELGGGPDESAEADLERLEKDR
jgi:hypothetical protein